MLVFPRTAFSATLTRGLTGMTSGLRLTPTGSSPTYAPTGGTEDSQLRKGSSMRRCIRRDGRSRGQMPGSMDSRMCLSGSTRLYPAGKVGISLPLSLYFLKKFTNQISLNNFNIICRSNYRKF